jgi:hypothetical protein
MAIILNIALRYKPPTAWRIWANYKINPWY